MEDFVVSEGVCQEIKSLSRSNRKIHQIDPEIVETFKPFKFFFVLTQFLYTFREISWAGISKSFNTETSSYAGHF